MRDDELLKQISQGNEAALETLYKGYYPRLARFLARLSNDKRLLEEVINDVFLVVWKNAEKFRGDSTPSTWIMGIAYKKMLKTLGRERKHNHEQYDQTATISESLLELGKAVRQLPRTHSAVVILTYEFGYSYREIGQMLGCPENTVKTRMFHARRSLKTLLEASD